MIFEGYTNGSDKSWADGLISTGDRGLIEQIGSDDFEVALPAMATDNNLPVGGLAYADLKRLIIAWVRQIRKDEAVVR